MNSGYHKFKMDIWRALAEMNFTMATALFTLAASAKKFIIRHVTHGGNRFSD